MVKKITWSPRSIKAYDRVIDYLSAKWSEKEIAKFIRSTQKTLDQISSGSVKFRRSNKRNIYEVLVTKHNLLLYRETKNAIELLTFFDTRQHPRKKFPK